jgi:hypothetical protein
MKELIKQILREDSMVIIHDRKDEYVKNISSIGNLGIQKLKSQGLTPYVISVDKRNITTFEVYKNDSEVKNKIKSSDKRIDVYYLTEKQAEIFEKVISKTNEIIELKYESIKLMSQHTMATIYEYYKKTTI